VATSLLVAVAVQLVLALLTMIVANPFLASFQQKPPMAQRLTEGSSWASPTNAALILGALILVSTVRANDDRRLQRMTRHVWSLTWLGASLIGSFAVLGIVNWFVSPGLSQTWHVHLVSGPVLADNVGCLILAAVTAWMGWMRRAGSETEGS